MGASGWFAQVFLPGEGGEGGGELRQSEPPLPATANAQRVGGKQPSPRQIQKVARGHTEKLSGTGGVYEWLW